MPCHTYFFVILYNLKKTTDSLIIIRGIKLSNLVGTVFPLSQIFIFERLSDKSYKAFGTLDGIVHGRIHPIKIPSMKVIGLDVPSAMQYPTYLTQYFFEHYSGVLNIISMHGPTLRKFPPSK